MIYESLKIVWIIHTIEIYLCNVQVTGIKENKKNKQTLHFYWDIKVLNVPHNWIFCLNQMLTLLHTMDNHDNLWWNIESKKSIHNFLAFKTF